MPYEEWSAELPNGRRVQYTNREMTETMACITAKVDGNDVVHTKNVRIPITHAEVEAEFADDVTTR